MLFRSEDASAGFQNLWPSITTNLGSTNNHHPQSLGPNPYTQSREDGLANASATVQGTVKACMQESFQLITAGADGKFGIGGVLGPLRDVSGSGAGTYNSAMPQKDASYDNFSNVTGGGQKVGEFHDGLISK